MDESTIFLGMPEKRNSEKCILLNIISGYNIKFNTLSLKPVKEPKDL
jgi:hypothetical protein